MANQLSFSITARNSASTAMNSLQKQVSSLKNGLKSLTGGTSESTKSIRQLNTESSQSTSLLSRMGQAASKAIGIFTGFSVVSSIFSTVRSSIDTALTRIDTMDLFADKMTMITGSAEQATWALDQLKTSTKGTPYALDQAAKAVQNFVLRGMDAQSAVDSVNIWMDAVSAYGNGTNEQLSSVLDAIAKMRTKGTVEMRYLNRLFAAGINPVQMYATATGQAASDVQTALSEKTINTTEFLNVVETAMREGTNGVIKVQGKAKELARTWTATLANMRIAIARGMAEIIQGLDDAFKVINPDSGLKGVVKAFGETMENIMDGIAASIKAVLPPILSVAKSAYDFWVKNFFEPIREYFENLKNITGMDEVVDTTRTALSEIQSVATGAISNITDAPFKQLETLKENFEILKEEISSTWKTLSKGTVDNETIKFDLNPIVTTVLDDINRALEILQQNIQVVVTWVFNLGQAFKTVFKSISVFVFKAIGYITTFGSALFRVSSYAFDALIRLVSKVAPTVQELGGGLLANIGHVLYSLFIDVDSVLNILLLKIGKFLTSTELEGWINDLANFFKDLSRAIFAASSELISFFKTLTAGDEAQMTDLTPVSLSLPEVQTPKYTFTDYLNKVVKIVKNILKTFTGIVKAFEPIFKGFIDLFTQPKDFSGFGDWLMSFLDSIDNFTSSFGKSLVKAAKLVSTFAQNLLKLVFPVISWIGEVFKNNVLPFIDSLARAFVNVATALEPVITAFGRFALTVAAFVVPLALQILTNILNWIADHAEIVAAAITTIVGAILLFKTVSTVTSVISVFSDVLIGTLIPAVSNFFTVMTTEGIGAALATLANPIVLVGVAVVAFIALAGALIYLYNTSDTAKQHILDFLDTVSNATPVLSSCSGHWEEIFSSLGDTLKWVGDELQKLQDKIDAFFDNLPEGFRSFFGTILSGPGYSLGGILGDDSDATKHTIDTKQLEQSLGSGKLSGLKFKVPDLNTNLDQWRKTAQECTDGVGQVVTHELPKVGANLTAQVQTLQGQTQATLDTNPADPTSYLQNLTGLPFEGGELGTQTSSNLTAYAQEVLNNSQLDPSSAMSMMYNLPTEGQNIGAGVGTGLSTGITGQSETVNESTSALGYGALTSINQYLGLDQAVLIGANFMNALTAGINVSASNVYMSLATFANNCLTQISAGFANTEDVSARIGGAMVSVIETVTASIDLMCQNLIIKLNDVLGTTMVTAQIVASSIETYFTTAQTNATTAIDNMCTGIIDRYNTFLSDFQTVLNTYQQDHNDIIQAVYPAFLNNVSVYLDLITAEYNGFSDSITRILESLKRYHNQAGIDMMTNLKDGIASKMGEVTKQASELVNQLKKTFEDGLGIASPSKYMTYIGQMLLAGLMRGMSPEKVQKFIDVVVGDMQTSFGNGKFNADQTVNYLSDPAVLNLIGRVSKVDTKNMNPEQIAYPLIGTMGSISSYFGNRESPGGIGSTNHAGMDLASDTGTPIASALAGMVTTAGWYGGYGNAVVVDSGNGLSIVYGHMSQVLSSVGQTVTKGQQIGLVGSTGNSTGPHLHFEMRQNGTPIDPYPYLQGAGISAGNTLAAVLQNAYNKKHGIVTAGSSSLGNVAYDVSAGASQWTNLILQALSMVGQPASLLGAVLATLDKESSGNPNAINLTDENATIRNTPSKGLMQVIDPTFRSYAMPGYDTNIWDPLSNILASLRYQLARYGGIEAHLSGYSVGTRYVPFDMPAIVHQGEAIIPASQNPYSNSGGDYLGDLIANALGSSGLNGISFDTSTLTGGNTNNNSTTNNNNLNNTFNITNSSDVDSDRSISEMESMLHRLLQDGKRVGVPR